MQGYFKPIPIKKIDARRIGGCNVGGSGRPHQIVVMQHHKSNNIVSTSATQHIGGGTMSY